MAAVVAAEPPFGRWGAGPLEAPLGGPLEGPLGAPPGAPLGAALGGPARPRPAPPPSPPSPPCPFGVSETGSPGSSPPPSTDEDPEGAPPREPPCPPGTGARVSPEGVVFVRGVGKRRLSELPPGGAEAWTGQGWAAVRVTPPAAGEKEELLRVRSSSGSCLVCASAHPCARLVGGEIVPTRARDLRLGDRLAPTPLPPPVEGQPWPQAYAEGRRGSGGRKPAPLPACLRDADPLAVAEYFVGRLDAQGPGGGLVGDGKHLRELQLELARAGYPSLLLERRRGVWVLTPTLPEAARLPDPQGHSRAYRRPPPPTVLEVCAHSGPTVQWVGLTAAACHTVVLDGALTLC